MIEIIKEVLIYVAPILAGFCTTILIPVLIKKFSVRHLQKKIDEITPTKEMQEIKRELNAIKKEIMEMRGKTK